MCLLNKLVALVKLISSRLAVFMLQQTNSNHKAIRGVPGGILHPYKEHFGLTSSNEAQNSYSKLIF